MAWKIWAAFDRLLAADLNANMAAAGGAPYGCIANSALLTGVGTTVVKIPQTVGGPNLNGGDFLVPASGAGVYYVSATAVIAALGGASVFRVYVYKNGAVVSPSGVGRWESVSAAGSGAHWCGLVELAAGDRISLHTSGGSGTSGLTCTGYLFARRLTDALV